MKILLVVHDFLPASVAGVEVFVHALARGLRRAGDEAVVAHTVRGVGLAQHALRRGSVDGIPTWELVQNYPYRPLDELTLDPQAERRFAQVMDRERPDRVHIHHLWGWSAGLPALARRAGVPTAFHLHDHWLRCPSGGQRLHPDGRICETVEPTICDPCYARFRSKEGPLERMALQAARRLPRPLPPDLLHRGFAALPGRARGVLKGLNERTGDPGPRVDVGGAERRLRTLAEALAGVDRFVAPSRAIAGRFRPLGIEPERVRVIPNGTALVQDSSPPPGGRDPHRPLELLFLGTPAHHKGPHVVAEAVARLDGVARLTVHGRDPAPSYARQLRGEHVRLAGPLPRSEVAGAIDRSDLVCLPSLWEENAPLVLLEARARGRAVLASDVGGVAESAEGRLLPPGDVDAWGQAIADLARDRRALRALCGGVRPPRTMEAVVSEHRALYAELEGSG